jgi:hypothetical protein
MPDLGYPEYADSTNAHRLEFMQNTISHNTVIVISLYAAHPVGTDKNSIYRFFSFINRISIRWGYRQSRMK